MGSNHSNGLYEEFNPLIMERETWQAYLLSNRGLFTRIYPTMPKGIVGPYLDGEGFIGGDMFLTEFLRFSEVSGQHIEYYSYLDELHLSHAYEYVLHMINAYDHWRRKAEGIVKYHEKVREELRQMEERGRRIGSKYDVDIGSLSTEERKGLIEKIRKRIGYGIVEKYSRLRGLEGAIHDSIERLRRDYPFLFKENAYS